MNIEPLDPKISDLKNEIPAEIETKPGKKADTKYTRDGKAQTTEPGQSSGKGHVKGGPVLLYYLPIPQGDKNKLEPRIDPHRYHSVDMGFLIDTSERWGAPLYSSPFAVAVNSAKMMGVAEGKSVSDGAYAVSGFFPTDVKIGNLNEKLYWAFPEGKTSDSTSLRLGKRGVINPLYQYNENADVREEEPFGSGYGQIYNEKIRKNDHIVFLQPGRPKWSSPEAFFLGQFRGTDNEDALRNAIASASLNDLQVGVSVAELIADLKEKSFNKNNPARFYDFIPDFENYRAYVRGLLNELMVRMGLDHGSFKTKFHLPFGATAASNVDAFTQFMQYWGFLDMVNAQNEKVGFKAKAGYLPFRVENTSSASDSWSTTIGASNIATQVKGVSAQAKETLYLTGGSATDSRGKGPLSNIAGGILQALGSFAGNISDPAEAIVKTGGNMLFPDVWQDSTISKSISLKIKLHAVYGNPRSYYENVLFPLCCLIAMVAPRQLASAVYQGPPLIRLVSKGWAYCDMGMVESLTISRGSNKNDWTVYGMPRTVECDLTIRDLMGSMMLSLGGAKKDTISVFHKRNTALREYLNVLAGIDTFADSFWTTAVEQKYRQIVQDLGQYIDPKNWLMGMHRVPIVGTGVKFAARWFGS